MNINMNKEIENKELGYCGLYCPSCIDFIVNNFDNSKIIELSVRSNKSVEEIICEGCRSNKLKSDCEFCEIRNCAQERQINFCSECEEYPCKRLKKFKNQKLQYTEIFESLNYVKDHTIDELTEKLVNDYSCPNCGTVNSPYYLTCRNCGYDPSSSFVKRHKNKIIKFFRN
jgi:hypothetical protein